MNEIEIVLWVFWVLVSVFLVFQFVGFSGLTRMFPEGHRRWHFPVQLATLVNFAAASICNPWR